MKEKNDHEELLKIVLDRIIENNRNVRPGTPMAELQSAIENAIENLPPLEFEDFNKAIGDTDAARKLLEQAPELIGWNTDQVLEWIEDLAKKVK
jgi:hypothetical protein